jgi:hypothetical protein
MNTLVRSILRNAPTGALAALALVATAASASASPILTITPSAATVSPGQDFSVDVAIQDATDLFFFDIAISIGDLAKASFRGTDNDPCLPDIAQCDSGDPDSDPTAEGPFLSAGSPGSTFYFDLYAGLDTAEAVNVVIGPGPGIYGNGVLFRAFFHASTAAIGTVDIDFGDVVLFDSSFNPLQPDLVGARVDFAESSTAVPEPATLGLVGTGVAALWRRRRSRRATPLGKRLA